VEATARAQPASAGPVYSRRQPEKTALYQMLQQHLLTFKQQWTDQASGRTLPKFVTEELHKYMDCGILGKRSSPSWVAPASASSAFSSAAE
jgi:hypothetical protein